MLGSLRGHVRLHSEAFALPQRAASICSPTPSAWWSPPSPRAFLQLLPAPRLCSRTHEKFNKNMHSGDGWGLSSCAHPRFSMTTSFRWTKLAGNNPWRRRFERKGYFTAMSSGIPTLLNLKTWGFVITISITNEMWHFSPVWLYFEPSSPYTILKHKPSITELPSHYNSIKGW